MTIMIVDDNPALRRLIKRLTKEVADQFYECEDGQHALALYAESRPDIVLMDIRMPKLDGLQATRALVKTHPEAKVVIVTDYGDEELDRTAREAGACALVNKQDLLELDELILRLHLQGPPQFSM